MSHTLEDTEFVALTSKISRERGFGCASGARSPLAPTEPREGTTGCTRALTSASSASSVSTLMPENPLARTFARSAIVARTVRAGSGSPRPAAWLRSRLN